MIRAGLRRLLVTFLIVLGGAAAISAALGGLAGRSIPRSVAIGYYLAGVGCLVIGFAVGSRGPTRPEGDDDPESSRPTAFGFTVSAGRRPRRKATPEERREARLASFGLFAFGVIFILLGAVIDPTRRAF